VSVASSRDAKENMRVSRRRMNPTRASLVCKESESCKWRLAFSRHAAGRNHKGRRRKCKLTCERQAGRTRQL
jgi:hypothetical protein